MKRITRLRQALWLLGAALLAAAVFLPIAAPARADEMGQNDVMFSGVLDSFSDDAWVVAGQALVVDSHTHIRLTAGPAEPGMWADVRATRQEDDSLLARQIVVRRPEVRLKGMVADKPEDTVGNWIIAGQTIVVNADTRISTRGGPVEEGRWVEVFAEESSNPTGLLALRIRAIRPQPAVEILGAIQAFAADSWTLSTIPLAVDAETLIAGEPQVSLLTHAAAELQDDGSLRALRLRVAWTEHDGSRPDIAFTGVVEALPAEGLEGLWTVSGRAVLVTAATAINQDKGPAEVGASVHVVGRQEGDQITAMRISVLDCPGECPQIVHLRGRIQDLPGQGLLVLWMIDVHQVLVTPRTRLAGARLARIGAWAEVGAFQPDTGPLTAVWLRVTHGPGPRVSEEAQLDAVD